MRITDPSPPPPWIISVYSEERAPHHFPHVHLRRGRGSAEIIVNLLTLEPLVGRGPLDRDIRSYLKDNQSFLLNQWQNRNPQDNKFNNFNLL